MLFLVSWFHSSFSKRQQNFGNWMYWKYILEVQDTVIAFCLLYERWSVHQGSEVGKDWFHMWKKCKYPAQIAYKAAGTVIHQQNQGFVCIAHTSLECGKVCYFLARAKESYWCELPYQACWIHAEHFDEGCYLMSLVFVYWFCFCWSSSVIARSFFSTC